MIMALTQRLALRQTQSLVMTPQLQQAIKLLQLSNLEVGEIVERELEQNPLLERDESEAAPPPEAPLSAAPADRIGTDRLTAQDGAAGVADQPLDTDYDSWGADDGGQDGGAFWQTGGGNGAASELDHGETIARPVSLRDHLAAQLALEVSSPAERLIGIHLIDRLDDNGYLTGDLAELAERLGCRLAEVEAVLVRLQGFDPPGLFARSLKECLALQLADQDRLTPAMAALLEHLELLARRDYAGLAAVCGVDGQALATLVGWIKALDPKPAQSFQGAPAPPVVPDVLMRPTPDGGWLVELNADTLPRLLVNRRYHKRVAAHATSAPDRAYLTERLAHANWLVKALDQRAQTILKVAAAIVERQQAFFRQGVAALRPLILRDVAAALGLHESTVSRVTSNKFMATPRGVLELKYFFTTAIAGTSGLPAHSAEAVRFRIRALIGAEAADAVLSDDQIVAILRADGIDIARRTVAKYREGMRIPSSVQRRREKGIERQAWPGPASERYQGRAP